MASVNKHEFITIKEVSYFCSQPLLPNCLSFVHTYKIFTYLEDKMLFLNLSKTPLRMTRRSPKLCNTIKDFISPGIRAIIVWHNNVLWRVYRIHNQTVPCLIWAWRQTYATETKEVFIGVIAYLESF